MFMMLLYTTLYEIPEINFGKALLLYSNDENSGQDISLGEQSLSNSKDRTRLSRGGTFGSSNYQSTYDTCKWSIRKRKDLSETKTTCTNSSVSPHFERKNAHAPIALVQNSTKRDIKRKSPKMKKKTKKTSNIFKSSSAIFNDSSTDRRPKSAKLEENNQFELCNITQMSPEQTTVLSISDSITPSNNRCTTVSQNSGFEDSKIFNREK